MASLWDEVWQKRNRSSLRDLLKAYFADIFSSLYLCRSKGIGGSQGQLIVDCNGASLPSLVMLMRLRSEVLRFDQSQRV